MDQMRDKKIKASGSLQWFYNKEHITWAVEYTNKYGVGLRSCKKPIQRDIISWDKFNNNYTPIQLKVNEDEEDKA